MEPSPRVPISVSQARLAVGADFAGAPVAVGHHDQLGCPSSATRAELAIGQELRPDGSVWLAAHSDLAADAHAAVQIVRIEHLATAGAVI
jgi:hypothetical protein